MDDPVKTRNPSFISGQSPDQIYYDLKNMIGLTTFKSDPKFEGASTKRVGVGYTERVTPK